MPDSPTTADLARTWTPYAESWAYRMDRLHPGADFWPAASRALHKSMLTYNPDLGYSFLTWLRSNLHQESRGVLKTWRRRSRKWAGEWEIDSAATDGGLGEVEDRDETQTEMARVNAAMQAVSPQSRRCIEARLLRGESRRSIAAVEQISTSYVNEQINAGIRHLRAILAG